MHEDRIAAAVKDPAFVERFWKKVEKTETCWLWKGTRIPPHGYGGVGLHLFGAKRARAHRVAWAIENGRIPDGICVLHRCDNVACVRPSHLFIGTVADNNRDKAEKGRAPRAFCEANGFHKLTEADVAEVRRLHASGARTKEIADMFGVDKSTIRYKLVGHRVVHHKNQFR